jgi:hypothetical protein
MKGKKAKLKHDLIGSGGVTLKAGEVVDITDVIELGKYVSIRQADARHTNGVWSLQAVEPRFLEIIDG